MTNKKKKILFLYGALNAGGAERVLIDLLRNLDYSKYEVTLCLIINGGLLLPEVPKQVTIISLWETYAVYYKLAFRMSVWYSSNYMFKRILNKKISNSFDVEVSFLEGMPLKLHALMDTKAKKISWVHCDLCRFHYTKNLFFKTEELDAYNKMDAVVCVSKDATDAFHRRFPTCRTPVNTIYNPIDCKKIELLTLIPAKKNSTFTIVCIGRLTLPKKIDRVIRLAARLKQEGISVKFQIIGDGELKSDLIAQANQLNVVDIVSFLGYKSNPYPYLKNADILLLSSGFEGFGLVVVEAMLLGVPVVSTKTSGPTELLDNNRFGLLCNHDDEAIYAAVKTMIESQELRNHYKKVGYDRALEFSIEKTIAQFDELIK